MKYNKEIRYIDLVFESGPGCTNCFRKSVSLKNQAYSLILTLREHTKGERDILS